MWKKYKNFLRKRTDMQLLVGVIIAILVMLVSIVLAVNKVWGVILYIAMVSLGYFVMITFCLEAGHRDAERRKELEREAHERLRKKLKEEVRKELEQENK